MSRREPALPGTTDETHEETIARRRRENAADAREIAHRAAIRNPRPDDVDGST